MSDTRAYFENSFESDRGAGLRLYGTVNAFLKGRLTGDVLDLGCGQRIYYDLSRAASWTGLDIAMIRDDALVFEAGSPSRAATVCGSADILPFAEASFDIVVANFMLHHLGRQDRATSAGRVTASLRESRRVLRPGGTLVVIENAARWPEWPYHLCYPVAYPLMRRLFGAELPHFWSVRQLTDLAREAGFSNAEYVHVPVLENMPNPVLRMSLPAWTMELLQDTTIYLFAR